MPSLYAEIGQQITCEENGHPVFKFNSPIYIGDDMDVSKITFHPDQVKPEIGTPWQDCRCHCGSHYYKSNLTTGGIIVHFKDEGWR